MADVQEQVAALKEQGNALFAAGDNLRAAAVYTSAIKLEPENAVLYSNRSAALLRLSKVTKALEDAEKCIALRPQWEKGYYRKGNVLEDQEQHAAALAEYQTALQLSPDNQELAVKVRTLAKIVQKKGAAAKPQGGAKQQRQASAATA